MHAFDPSNSASYLFGPKTLILIIFKKSTIPLTNASSGPTTTKSILYNLIKQVYMSLNEDPNYNYVEQVPIPSTGFAIKVNDEIIDLNEYFLPNDPSSNTFTSALSKNEDFITTDDTNLTSYFCKSLASSSTFESNYVIANADIARKLEPFHYRVVGMIKIWSGTTLPAHHLLCDGSGVNIHEYPKLFTMI